MPHGGNGSVLITSQKYAAKDCFFENGPGVDLDPLSTSEAATLLQQVVLGPDEGLDRPDQEALTKLTSMSGGVPEVITRMAESVRNECISLPEYAELLGLCCDPLAEGKSQLRRSQSSMILIREEDVKWP